MLLTCFTCQFAVAQKDSLKVLKNQEAIVVLKLAICDAKFDEYCLVSHDVYIKRKKYTLGDSRLLGRLDSIARGVADASIAGLLSEGSARGFAKACSASLGYKNIAGTSHFANEILANGDTWRRNKGGDMFIQRTQHPYDNTTVYLVYKIKGNFAMAYSPLEKFYADFYEGYYQPKIKEKITFPVVEVLAIESFSSISSKDAKRIGIKPFRLEYYRLKTTGMEALFDQTGKGKRDH